MTSEINNTPQEKNAGCFGIGFSVIFPIVLKTEDIHPPKTGISIHFSSFLACQAHPINVLTL